jgi:hypothetical protein
VVLPPAFLIVPGLVVYAAAEGLVARFAPPQPEHLVLPSTT